MTKFFSTIYINIKDFFDRYFVAITIIIGIISLSYGLAGENSSQIICKISYTIGSISLTSGIFAGIAKSNQFTEIYKKIIRDIIYGNEHLEKRNDLEQIWENVTQTLSNKKFQKISRSMNKNIKKYFLPLEHDYYYNDFNVEINIEFAEGNEDYVTLKQITQFTIICEDESLKINNRLRVETKLDLKNKTLTQYNLKELVIDNVVQKDIKIDNKYERDLLISTYEKSLTGKKSYVVKRTDERSYNLKYNPIKKQLAVWVYNNCNVDITYPKNLKLTFENLGVLNSFDIDDRNLATHNRLKATYKGLIYKNQGFFLYFRKN